MFIYVNNLRSAGEMIQPHNHQRPIVGQYLAQQTSFSSSEEEYDGESFVLFTHSLPLLLSLYRFRSYFCSGHLKLLVKHIFIFPLLLRKEKNNTFRKPKTNKPNNNQKKPSHLNHFKYSFFRSPCVIHSIHFHTDKKSAGNRLFFIFITFPPTHNLYNQTKKHKTDMQ